MTGDHTGDTGSYRTWRIGTSICIALLVASTSYLAHRIFVVGLTAEQRLAAEKFSNHPLETLTEPLFALLFSTAFVCGLAALVLVCFGYVRWRHARLERLAIERDLSGGRE